MLKAERLNYGGLHSLTTDIGKVTGTKKEIKVAWKLQLILTAADTLVLTFRKPYTRWIGLAKYLAPILNILEYDSFIVSHLRGQASSVHKIKVGKQWTEFKLILANFINGSADFKLSIEETLWSQQSPSLKKGTMFSHTDSPSEDQLQSVIESNLEIPVNSSTPNANIVSADTPYPVWYATNRESIRDEAGDLLGFSGNLALDMSVGKCLVHIPKGHVIGQTRLNFWHRWWRRLTLQRDDQALRMISLEPQPSDSYWNDIQNFAAQWTTDERCAVIFLHGYNVSFVESAIRAAQFGYDLQVRGPVGFFSWPSKGTLFGYPADEAAIEASEEAITHYLCDFTQRCGAERIHVIAHSMGNRGLLRALQRILARAANTTKLFEHIILAAPDVDQKLFLSLADHYNQAARHTTLYVSSKDLALASSKMLRTGMARAGLSPPITTAPHIDTVQVANVDISLLGHGYVAEARDVLADMHQLLYQNAPPNQRMGLRPAEEAGQQYWIISA
jgi:esterase/lipase superfamily enzyme